MLCAAGKVDCDDLVWKSISWCGGLHIILRFVFDRSRRFLGVLSICVFVEVFAFFYSRIVCGRVLRYRNSPIDAINGEMDPAVDDAGYCCDDGDMYAGYVGR